MQLKNPTWALLRFFVKMRGWELVFSDSMKRFRYSFIAMASIGKVDLLKDYICLGLACFFLRFFSTTFVCRVIFLSNLAVTCFIVATCHLTYSNTCFYISKQGLKVIYNHNNTFLLFFSFIFTKQQCWLPFVVISHTKVLSLRKEFWPFSIFIMLLFDIWRHSIVVSDRH